MVFCGCQPLVIEPREVWHMLELLAPAGSMEALRAAVQNGADAVYLGVGPFNARQGARNFTVDTLREAVKYAHIRGAAVHLTLNTLVSDREAPQAAELIRAAARAEVDAFIVQDLGVLSLCRQIAPHIPIHASTQMSIHSLDGVQQAAALGVSRVVLARELSREEIARICRNSPVEIEVFVHGALCMCYSGQCYMSGVIGRRSGNRGQCAQPCRLPYGYGRFENKYPMSLKDNCLISYLRDLASMGVASIKLEGRMKRPEYVATVTRVYREALNTGRVTQRQMDDLTAAFSRQGFTDGYFRGETGQAMFGTRGEEREDKARLAAARATYESVENPRVPVQFYMIVNRETSMLAVQDPQGNVCKTVGPRPEPAQRRGLTEAELSARLAKTGGTAYTCARVSASVEPGLSLSAAAVNAMRREVLTQLTALRGRREEAPLGKFTRPMIYPGQKEAPGLTVQVTATEQVTRRILELNPLFLYVPLHLLVQDWDFYATVVRRVRLAAVLPRVIHDTELPRVTRLLDQAYDLGVRHVLLGNLGQIPVARARGFAICGDFGLNIYNSRSMNTLRTLGLASATASFEMTLPQIRDLSKAVPTEAIVYGRLPLMITENCLIRGRTGQCTCATGSTKLLDRKGEEFPIVKDCGTCRSVVLNGKKLYWLDRQSDWRNLGLYALRLLFTTENPREVDQVLRAWQSAAPFDPGGATRGLYLRGVE